MFSSFKQPKNALMQESVDIRSIKIKKSGREKRVKAEQRKRSKRNLFLR